MRILFLTHAFNSLTQRLFVELRRLGHEVSVEFDINDRVSEEAVALYAPDLVLAPFLKRAIPESIWQNHLCWIVHPGPLGDRGPSSLDWAIAESAPRWGVTVLQAEAAMDAGPVWASVPFAMRPATKGSLYRGEVTEAAVQAVRQALDNLATPGFTPQRAPVGADGQPGTWRPLMCQAERAIDWSRDDTATVLARLSAADGHPGVLDEIGGLPVYLHAPWPESSLRGQPGEILGTRDGAICRATLDGAVWITHLREPKGLKLPATQVLGERLAGVSDVPLDPFAVPAGETWQEIRYREANGVGYLFFDFHNGAMSPEQCRRLQRACERADQCDTRVLVLMGGRDFWSNGIHLTRIEADEHPAEASWENIQAMDDLTRTLIEMRERLVVSVMRGNAGAGGVFLALAADQVWATPGVLLNPHYKNMGNLYGSEYWTYLLPRRVGEEAVDDILGNRLPLGTPEALSLGLLDAVLESQGAGAEAEVMRCAEALAGNPALPERIAAKARHRAEEEAHRPLQAYRDEELARMSLNFFGFDPSYHVARYSFVWRRPHSRTPLHLALHRSRKVRSGKGECQGMGTLGAESSV
ncbi:hydrogenase maturation protein [Halomonas faecis]|uniref:hydrogenase maturation protein n=1 Tax=Halomonas faecis TaxID=1562110 RepID=UPI0013D49F6B|nr:hydrogenase maturation protein [Halomonas faecis]